MMAQLSPKRRFAVLARCGFACVYCGKRPPEIELHIDHKIPVGLGGSNEDANLVAACRACNTGKGDELFLGIPEHLSPAVQLAARVRQAAKEPRTATVNARVTLRTRRRLEKLAERLRCSMSDVVRKLIATGGELNNKASRASQRREKDV
jgi:hypothetical protein